MHIYIYIYTHICIYIYIYIYMLPDPRAFDLPQASRSLISVGIYPTVGSHNFNLRIFNLRVSNPNKLIVDVFFDTMSDFNVPGSRPKKTR